MLRGVHVSESLNHRFDSFSVSSAILEWDLVLVQNLSKAGVAEIAPPSSCITLELCMAQCS